MDGDRNGMLRRLYAPGDGVVEGYTMTELRQELGRLARVIEVLSSIAVVLGILGLLYVVARSIRWAVDPSYHVFK